MRKVIIAGMVGNALEWYDYALYAQFATIIGQVFIDSEARDMITFAIFASGFIVRPLGGIMFGMIGDRLGRKAALSVGILLMAFPTAAIGVLPGHDAIGIVAPISLVLIRVLQGLSLGGEFSGCISYLVEHSEKKYRGLVGSLSFVSMCLGMLLGSAAGALVTRLFDSATLLEWGWRMPFIFGLFVGLVGFYIRNKLKESPIYHQAKQSGQISKRPVRELFAKHYVQYFVCVAIYTCVTAPFYIITVYINSFLCKQFGYKTDEAEIVGIVGLMTMMIIFPISAGISDMIGRKKVLLFGSISIALLYVPVFNMFEPNALTNAIIAEMLLAGLLGIYMGPVPTVLVESFPTRVRFSGIATSYNTSAAIFGGTAPMAAILAIKIAGGPIGVAVYLCILAIFATIVIAKLFNSDHQNAI